MATNSRSLRACAPYAGGPGDLIQRLIAFVDLSDLEQCDIRISAVGVLLAGGNKPWDQAWPHIGEIGRNRIGQRKLGLAAAKKFGLRLGDEGPRHRFNEPARAERPFGFAGAQLDWRENRLAGKFSGLEWRRGNTLNADDADHLFDDVGLSMHVRPPGWDRDLELVAGAGKEKPEMSEHALEFGAGGFDAGKPFHFVKRKINDALGDVCCARNDRFRGRPAAELDHHLGGEIQPRTHEGRINAAFKTIPSV